MPEELEWKTRKERVDRKLKSLHPAWSIVKYRPGIDASSLPCHAVKEYTQKTGQATRTALEKLVEAGLVEAHGTGRGRTYTLSAKVYRRVGQKAAYVRQAGFDNIQQTQMVLSYIDKHGSIKRSEAAELCRIGNDQAHRLLKRLKKSRIS